MDISNINRITSDLNCEALWVPGSDGTAWLEVYRFGATRPIWRGRRMGGGLVHERGGKVIATSRQWRTTLEGLVGRPHSTRAA